MNQLPKVLYKYRSFDKNGYGKQMALGGVAYFSSAKELNDPFETQFTPQSKLLELDGEALHSFLHEKTLAHYPNVSADRIMELVQTGIQRREYLLNRDPRGIEPILDVQNRKYGILSLTATPKSIPMWGYYADSHKGICVGFDMKSIAEHQNNLLKRDEILSLRKVRYKKRLPVCNIDFNGDRTQTSELEALEATVYTKSRVWKHEEEYRLLFFDHPSFAYTFGSDAIAEVIVGINAKEEDYLPLITQLVKTNPEVKILRAVNSISTYAIEFVDAL